MFSLTQKEKEEVVAICDHLKGLKFSPHTPYAFTEHGAIMLASILNSEAAIHASVQVVRAFIRLRQVLYAHKELSAKLDRLEQKTEKHDEEIQAIFSAIRQLMKSPKPVWRKIGFH